MSTQRCVLVNSSRQKEIKPDFYAAYRYFKATEDNCRIVYSFKPGQYLRVFSASETKKLAYCIKGTGTWWQQNTKTLLVLWLTGATESDKDAARTERGGMSEPQLSAFLSQQYTPNMYSSLFNIFKMIKYQSLKSVKSHFISVQNM